MKGLHVTYSTQNIVSTLEVEMENNMRCTRKPRVYMLALYPILPAGWKLTRHCLHDNLFPEIRYFSRGMRIFQNVSTVNQWIRKHSCKQFAKQNGRVVLHPEIWLALVLESLLHHVFDLGYGPARYWEGERQPLNFVTRWRDESEGDDVN